MRKFKLIKEYPGSPKLGVIVQTGERCLDIYEYNIQGYPTNGGRKANWVHSKIVENYPEFWKEVKEPVFISDDGVEMFKGDNVYFVVNFELSTMIYVVNDWFKTATPDYKRFSTKEAALKYIDLNKPKYSKSDVIEALRKSEYYSVFVKPFCEEFIKHLFGE